MFGIGTYVRSISPDICTFETGSGHGFFGWVCKSKLGEDGSEHLLSVAASTILLLSFNSTIIDDANFEKVERAEPLII